MMKGVLHLIRSSTVRYLRISSLVTPPSVTIRSTMAASNFAVWCKNCRTAFSSVMSCPSGGSLSSPSGGSLPESIRGDPSRFFGGERPSSPSLIARNSCRNCSRMSGSPNAPCVSSLILIFLSFSSSNATSVSLSGHIFLVSLKFSTRV